MKNLIIVILAIVAIANIGASCQSAKELQVYKSYYLATECLLDTLEGHYNWVDAIDNDGYYTAIHNVKALK